MRRILIVAAAIALVFALSIVGSQLTAAHVTPTIDTSSDQFTAPSEIKDRFGSTAAVLFPAVVLSICTLLGIVAQIFWTRSTERNLKLSLNSFAPILVSPIILYATYGVAKDHPDGIVAALIAFQNGFFWQSIFQRAKPSVDPITKDR